MSDKIQYTCHPIRNLRIGRFCFQDATITFGSEDDEKEFLALIDSPRFPSRERLQIKKLDLRLAEAISKEIQATKPRVTQVTDSSVGERATSAPKIGVTDLLKGTKAPDSDTLKPE
jgi:hypothetical protein